MRKIQLAPWAFAAVMAVALPGTPAWALSNTATVQVLKSQLPQGVTLASASISETATALSYAVTAHPNDAVGLTEVAILAKTPKRGHGRLSTSSLVRIVQAAIQAAPQEANDIVQMALTLHPEAADALNALLTNPPANPSSLGGNAPDGFRNPTDDYGGFGVGFGPGFPGSPGFSGSTPSGAIALPPDQVTSVLNG